MDTMQGRWVDVSCPALDPPVTGSTVVPGHTGGLEAGFESLEFLPRPCSDSIQGADVSVLGTGWLGCPGLGGPSLFKVMEGSWGEEVGSTF